MISGESTTYAPRRKNPEMTSSSLSKVPKPLEIYDKKTDTMYQLNDDFIKSLLFEGANVFSILKEDSTKGGSLVFGSQVAEQLEKYREENELLNLSRRSFDLLDARDVGTIGTDTLGRLGIITEPLFRSLAGFVGETNILPGSQKLRSLDDNTNLFGGFLPGIPFQEEGTSYILSDRERAIKALNNMMDVSGGKARSDVQMNPYAESDLRARLDRNGFDLDMLMPGPNFNPQEKARYENFIASEEATEDPLSKSSIASDIEELETASSLDYLADITRDVSDEVSKKVQQIYSPDNPEPIPPALIVAKGAYENIVTPAFEFLKNLKPPRANSIEDSINEITAEATKPPVNSALKDIEKEEIVIEDSGKIDENGKNILIKPTTGQEGEIILSEEGNITQSDDDGNIIVSNNQGEVISVNGETPEISTENINENTISSFSQSPVAKSLQSGMSLGASLADMFQKISAVPNVKNTLDLLQGGAQTYSALNLAEEAAEKKDTRAYQTALAKEIAKARSEINKPLSVTENAKLTESSLEVDQAVTDFKNASQNLALIDQLIEISKDPDIKGWRGFIGKLTTKTEAFLAAGGETPKTFDELPPRVQFEKLMTIVSQKNIKEILNETGKTISNIDRDIVDRIMGKITVFTDPAETLKALQLAREDSLKNLESYRNKGRTLLGFLKEYGKVPGSAQTETDILEQLINFDRKTYRSNLTNENFTSGAGVSYAGTPVYNLSGQKISD